MSHLSTERLAALLDEPATATEQSHLASCTQCAGERQAHMRLASLAKQEQHRIGIPLTTFESIAARLPHASHASQASQTSRATRPASWRVGRAASRAAAAFVLMAGGAAVGRYSAGASLLPNRAENSARARATSPVRTPSTSAAATATPTDTVLTTFASLADARAARARYGALFQQASAYVADHDSVAMGASTPAAMRTRLAALDRVDRALRDAMTHAPSDPVINGYYLTTVGQREQTIRQLNTAMPAGMGITTF